MKVSKDDRFMTVEEVAEIFAVQPYTVRGWCKDGKIKAIKIGKQWRIQQSVMQDYAQGKYGDNL